MRSINHYLRLLVAVFIYLFSARKRIIILNIEVKPMPLEYMVVWSDRFLMGDIMSPKKANVRYLFKNYYMFVGYVTPKKKVNKIWMIVTK